MTEKIIKFRTLLNQIKTRRECINISKTLFKEISKNKVPVWIVKAYIKLFDRFGYKKFSWEEATDCIGLENVHMHLKELKNHKLLTMTLNKKDARKRDYRLRR